jgi:PncC family amidohydrolase
MDLILPHAEKAAAQLKARGQTIAVAESSAGGLIAAALVAQPGASAYFLGGTVVYTVAIKRALLNLPPDAPRSASEPYALLLARTMREKLGADWGLAETGASGPTGNRYGDAPGHSCMAVVNKDGRERVITLETGDADRQANMRAFALEALVLLQTCLADENPSHG